jgi:putative ABC transport system substrate-binding protein
MIGTHQAAPRPPQVVCLLRSNRPNQAEAVWAVHDPSETWAVHCGNSFQPLSKRPVSAGSILSSGVGGDMRRRDFITLLGGTATWPLATRAQQPAMPVVGFLHVGVSAPYAHVLAAFRQGLKESGFIEGQNVAIEQRWAENQNDRLPELAADLVRRQVAVILSGGGGPSALAAKAATSTIPIVFAFGSDPVQLGLVASLSRPGRNVTGVTFLTVELMPKRLDFLHQMVPQAATIAYLADTRSVVGQGMLRDMHTAAAALGRQLAVVEARSERDFEPAFPAFIERQAGALVVGASPLFDSNRHQLVALAARHKLPAIYQAREYAVDGGLMSYGANFGDAFRLGGRYVGQILKGAKPADRPVEQSSRFELVINMNAAKTLGLDVPPTLLIRADELIE